MFFLQLMLTKMLIRVLACVHLTYMLLGKAFFPLSPALGNNIPAQLKGKGSDLFHKRKAIPFQCDNKVFPSNV